MNTKLVIIAILLLGWSQVKSQNRPVGEPGKYQLTGGAYTTFIKAKDGGKHVRQESLFKIDTQTGQVWMFMNTIDTTGGKDSEQCWLAVVGPHRNHPRF